MLSDRSWKNDAVLRLLLGVFVFFCVGQMVLGALENFGVLPATSERHLISLFITTLTFQGAAILLVVFFLHEQHLSWSQAFGFGSPQRGRTILLGLVAGVVIVPVAWMLQQLSVEVMQWVSLEPETQEIVQKLQETIAKTPPSTELMLQQTFFGISVIVIAPIAEELLFRGILYPTFKQAGHAKLGLWVTSFLFAFLHNNGPSFVPFLVLAILLVLVYEATDNLLAPILTHSFFNTANFLYLLYEKPVNNYLQRLGFT